MTESRLIGESSEQEQKPQILLEIGHSTRSLAEHSQIPFTEGQIYIGLELSENSNAYAVHSEFEQNTLDRYRAELKTSRPGEDIRFITGDARRIPLAPESVDKVFLANVTDSPARVDKPQFFDELMLSVRQVLKPGGEVIVFEDRTPAGTGVPYDAKVRQLRMLGFEVSTHIATDDPEFENMREQYGMNHNSGTIVPLLDEYWKAQIEKSKLNNPDWVPRTSKAHNGDYFMLLRKSKDQPTIVPGETSNSWDLAWKEIEEEMRKKGLGQYLDDKKKLEAYNREVQMRAERRKELAILVGKTVGSATVRGIKKLRKHIKDH